MWLILTEVNLHETHQSPAVFGYQQTGTVIMEELYQAPCQLGSVE